MVSFTVTACGKNLSYQWRKDGQDLSDSGEYSGSATSMLSIKSFSHELEGNYSCIVKNSGGEIESEKAKLSFSGMYSPSCACGHIASIQTVLCIQWRKC